MSAFEEGWDQGYDEGVTDTVSDAAMGRGPAAAEAFRWAADRERLWPLREIYLQLAEQALEVPK